MRTFASVALIVVLAGLVAVCPLAVCFSPSADHACCPHHKAPADGHDCPSQALEKGKTAPFVSTTVPALAAQAIAIPAFFPSLEPPSIPPAHQEDLYLLVRVLRV